MTAVSEVGQPLMGCRNQKGDVTVIVMLEEGGRSESYWQKCESC